MKTAMRYNILLAAMAMTVPCLAQQNGTGLSSRSMTVEVTYNPNTGQAGKLMPVPEKEVAFKKDVAVTYVTDSVAPSSLTSRDRQPMTVLGAGTERPVYPTLSGYAGLGYGFRNVSDGNAGLRWRISDNDILDVTGSLGGSNSEVIEDWRSRIFHAGADASYSHFFKRFAIDAFGSLGYSHRNFRQDSLATVSVEKDWLMQRTHESGFGLRVRSYGDGDVKWNVGVSRELLDRSGLRPLDGIAPCNEEKLLRIDAGASMPLKGGRAQVLYRQKTAAYDWFGQNGCEYRNFSTFTLTPSWAFNVGDLAIGLGVNIDARTALGNKFMFSPSSSIVYNVSDRLQLDVLATGGVEDNCMRRLAVISPYWSETSQIRDGYTLVNTSAGATWSATPDMRMSLRAGYRFTLDELFQIPKSDTLMVTSAIIRDDAHVFYVSANVDMDFSERVTVNANVLYNSWVGGYKGDCLMLKPVVDASVFGHVNIIPGLDASISYRFIQFVKTSQPRMKPVNDLGVKFDWDYNDSLSFFCTMGNLLGGNFQYYAGYRGLKPYALAGATYRF